MNVKKKTVLIPALAILILCLALLARFTLFSPSFVYVGTVEVTKVDLPARVASVIASVPVREGDKVKPDQVVVELSCEDIKLSAKLANENYTRALRLFKVGSMPQETFDQVANRKQESDLKVGWCSIESPITGTVLARYKEPAEWVNPGTRILTLANLKQPWAYLYVPQPLVAKLSLGMKVIGRLPELNSSVEGKIVWISDQAEFTPKNVQTRAERTRLVFAVKVDLDNSNEILKPGMSVEVSLPD